MAAQTPSRVARTKLRTKQRIKEAREGKLKAQVDSWFGAPLRDALAGQAQSVKDVSKMLCEKESNLISETRGVSERVTRLERSLGKIVKDEVRAVINTFQSSSDKVATNLECRLAEACRDIDEVKDIISRNSAKLERDFRVFEVSSAQRLEDLEHTSSQLQNSKATVENLTVEFDNFIGQLHEREAHTRRLEVLIKDMESRVWPWRKHMDRSNSPPRRDAQGCLVPDEDRIMPWQSACMQDESLSERPQWAPWPPYKGLADVDAVKASPTSSHGPTPPASARPTPPTSRPSSAHYRGRDLNVAAGRAMNVVARPNSAAAKAARPSRPASASTARSYQSMPR